MTLRTRLTTLVAALVGGVAVLMGGAVVQVAYLTSIDSVDHTLAAVAEEAASAQQDGLTAALYAASAQPTPVAVALFSQSTPATWVLGGEGFQIPQAEIHERGQGAAETVLGNDTYRVRAARLEDGDSVFLVVDIESVLAERSKNLRIVLVISLLLALLGAGASRLLVRRDLERIRELTDTATLIAQGDLRAALPEAVGVSEVDALAAALRHMLESLTTSFDALQTSHAQLRTFLGDVSHELRTPLTVVRGYVELLENSDQLESELRERAVARSLGELERMQSLIADLLLLAEYAEQSQPRQDDVDLSELVRDEAIDLIALSPVREVSVSLPEGDVHVTGDRRALASACSNLFGNIRRHTPASAPVRVTMELSQRSCVLAIDDGGPGLSPEQYAVDPNALERFNRMRSDTTGGSGLGLRIVATVAQLHGGTLRLQPSALGGLRVELELPLASATTL